MTRRTTRFARVASAVAAMSSIAAPLRAQRALPISAEGRVDTAAVARIVRTQADSGFTGVVLVAVGDTVIFQQAFGRTNAPRPTSAFWIGSITKGFTAAAILALQDEGRLSVHDSIARFFPDAPLDRRDITLHQLLTHTSGIPGGFAGADIVDRDSAVRAILAQPLLFAPGTGYRYGDDDYELLAAVVEVAAGVPWHTYVEHRLLRPASLSHIGFWCTPRSGAPSPVASSRGTRTRCTGADWGHRGATGISSTAADLLHWVDALGPSGPLESIGRALATPRILVRTEPPDEVHYGYGVRVYTRDGRTTEVMHSGAADDDHTSIVRVLPSGVRVVVVSSSGMRRGTTWASYVAGLLVAR